MTQIVASPVVRQLKRIACSVLVLITTAATNVAAGPQTKCLVGKNKCVSKTAGALLKCEQRAETPGRPADPNAGGCVDTANAKFDGGSNPTMGCFEMLENMTYDCVTFHDTASVEMLVDTCVAEIVAAIDPGPIDQRRCGVVKKKCAAKTLKSVLRCYEKAETPGKSNDPNFKGCIDKAKARFDGGSDPTRGCFEKLENETGNDCLPPLDNTAVVAGIIDNSCVGAFVTALTPTTTTTTTTLPCALGQPVGNFCWFLGASGADCDATCAAQGLVYDAATATYAGSAGTNANCEAVLTALGPMGTVFDISFSVVFGGAPIGLGCSGGYLCTLECDQLLLRDTDPTTSEAASPGFLRACACM